MEMNGSGSSGNRRPPAAQAKKDNRRSTGILGEEAAAAHLLSQGYELLHRNWRCRSGELDIVARTGETTVIVEVRTRASTARFGTAAESVDFRKQLRVRKTAQMYLQTNGLLDTPVRFDVIALTLNGPKGEIMEINHIQAAF